MDFLPLVSFQRIDSEEANFLLVRWQHKMGEIKRPFPSTAYGLFHEGKPVGVTVHACLIRDNPGGALYLNRGNTIELARLCAEGPHLCRVVLRLWREFVFPNTGKRYAVSYQDLDAHTGATYRLDGWSAVGDTSSGTDKRSGRKGRKKRCWMWENQAYPSRAQTHGFYMELMAIP